jgi:hypothetical protein
MKNYIKLIFIYFLLAGNVYAFCDFDNFKIGFATTSNEDLITSDTDDFSYLGNHGFEKIDGEQICNDNAYHDLTFDGEYILNNLVAVSLYEANTPINHLENITHFYGQPSNINVRDAEKGIDYYHWDLDAKQIFLILHNEDDDIFSHVAIVSSDYEERLKSIKK